MTQKVRDLITGSLRLISVVQEGNPPTEQAMADGLYAFNEVVDSWNTTSARIYNRQPHDFPLTQAKQIWTIGPVTPGYPTPDFIIPIRPMLLTFANYVYPSEPLLNVPMDVLSDQEWAEIRMLGVYTPISNKIYLDKTWPIANIYLWPIPTINTTLTLWYTELLRQSNLDTPLNLPPGYAKALRYATALALAPEYGKPIPPDVASAYSNLVRDIQTANFKTRHMSYNSESQGVSASGTYNVFDDKVYGA